MLPGGIYQQMPFFKELKNSKAGLVSGVKAQKSIHYVAGLDYPFNWGDRPFKFSTELWYKIAGSPDSLQSHEPQPSVFPDQTAKAMLQA